MGSALYGVNPVTKSQNIFLKAVRKLKSTLELGFLTLSFKINYGSHRLLGILYQLFHKGNNPIWLVILDFYRLISSFVSKEEMQIRV